MNRAAHEQMDSPPAFNLLYDPANNSIGLKPTGRADAKCISGGQIRTSWRSKDLGLPPDGGMQPAYRGNIGISGRGDRHRRPVNTQSQDRKDLKPGTQSPDAERWLVGSRQWALSTVHYQLFLKTITRVFVLFDSRAASRTLCTSRPSAKVAASSICFAPFFIASTIFGARTTNPCGKPVSG